MWRWKNPLLSTDRRSVGQRQKILSTQYLKKEVCHLKMFQPYPSIDLYKLPSMRGEPVLHRPFWVNKGWSNSKTFFQGDRGFNDGVMHERIRFHFLKYRSHCVSSANTLWYEAIGERERARLHNLQNFLSRHGDKSRLFTKHAITLLVDVVLSDKCHSPGNSCKFVSLNLSLQDVFVYFDVSVGSENVGRLLIQVRLAIKLVSLFLLLIGLCI